MSQKKDIQKLINRRNRQQAEHTYAIILSGGININCNYERYWHDCSYLYQILTVGYQVPKDHIIPIMADGEDPAEDTRLLFGGYVSQNLDLDNDGINENILAATKSNIISSLNQLNGKMAENDQLLFFVIDHGGSDDFDKLAYICLWGNDQKLYASELSNMMRAYFDRNIVVNLVLGQCFSGGFIQHFEEKKCVVSTACQKDEMSYANGDNKYSDKFVYNWTNALNEATLDGSPVNSDYNHDGYICMKEAYEYAKNLPKEETEHPQYYSYPEYLGKKLSIDRIPSAIDSYIKDNSEDLGEEPNITTSLFWDSPSIWVRNNPDGVEQHENPVYSSDHKEVTVYVKVHENGLGEYRGNRFVNLYWAYASAGLTDKVWKGLEFMTDKSTGRKYPTGGHAASKLIPNLDPEGSVTVPITWKLPDYVARLGKGSYHFCLLAVISNSPFEDDYDENEAFFNVLGLKTQAQKNVSILNLEDLSTGVDVIVRNTTDAVQQYSLELTNRKDINYAEMYPRMAVGLSLSEGLYSSWKSAGCLGEGFEMSTLQSYRQSPVNGEVLSPKLKVISNKCHLRQIRLQPNETGIVRLDVNLMNGQAVNDRPVFEITQIDAAGKIIGGETIILDIPAVASATIPIRSELTAEGGFRLSVEEDGYSFCEWSDGEENIIGNGLEITVNPTKDGKAFYAKALTESGEMAFGNVELEKDPIVKGIKVSNGSQTLMVEFWKPTEREGRMTIISPNEANIKSRVVVPAESDSIAIDISQLQSGIYTMVYETEGLKVASASFVLSK